MGRALLFAVLGGILGGALVWFAQNQSFSLRPANMAFSDFAAIVLAGVSVMVTVLGVFIATLAIWGFSQFKQYAERAAKTHVGEQLKDGDIKHHIEKLVGRLLTDEFKVGNLRALVEERIDFVLYSSAEQRAAAQRQKEQEAEDETDF